MMDFEQLLAETAALWPRLQNAAVEMVQPWRLYQLAIGLFLFALAHIAARHVGAAVRARLRAAEGVPKWRLRVALIVLGRLRAVLFVLLLWATILAMREVTWPSRSWLLTLGASLVTTWVFVAIASRLIRGGLYRTVVSWGAWTLVTLHLLGLLPQSVELLDGLALTVGEQRISALLVLKGGFLLILGAGLAGWLDRAAERRITAAPNLSPSMKVLAAKAAGIVLYGLAVLIGLQAVGFDLTTLTVLSGAIGLGLGFGLQKVVSNLVSGVILLLDRSIKPGDVISLGDTFGWITTLGARYASVVTRDGREYLIPNEDLITGQVVNWSRSSDLVRLDIHFGTAYANDPHHVRKVSIAAAKGVARVVESPAPVCHITGFGDSSVDYILRFWIRDPTGGLTNVRGNVFLALWDAFQAEGIHIPFPQREVTILKTPGDAAGEAPREGPDTQAPAAPGA